MTSPISEHASALPTAPLSCTGSWQRVSVPACTRIRATTTPTTWAGYGLRAALDASSGEVPSPTEVHTTVGVASKISVVRIVCDGREATPALAVVKINGVD